MNDKLQVEILDFMIDEFEDTNDLLLERVKRLEKFRSNASNTAQNEADRSRCTETKLYEGRTRCHYDTRLQMVVTKSDETSTEDQGRKRESESNKQPQYQFIIILFLDATVPDS